MKVKAAVITVSDKGSRGEREDTSGPAVAEKLREAGFEIGYQSIIPDEQPVIEAELIKCADELGMNLAVTTGGNQFAEADYGMGQPGGIAQQQVHQPSGQKRDNAYHWRPS